VLCVCWEKLVRYQEYNLEISNAKKKNSVTALVDLLELVLLLSFSCSNKHFTLFGPKDEQWNEIFSIDKLLLSA
jgi:hypothetical protein